LDAHTKAKVDLDANKNGGYIAKEKDKKYINNTRVTATMRVGYGNVTLFGSYTLTDLFKEGQGPRVKPFSVGLTLSGL
jgi:hypothetical protein